MANGNGGKRAGAGAPRGPHKRTIEFSAKLNRLCKKQGLNVWEGLIEIAKDTHFKETAHRLRALTELASYLEVKRQHMTVVGDADAPLQLTLTVVQYETWLDQQSVIQESFGAENGHYHPPV